MLRSGMKGVKEGNNRRCRSLMRCRSFFSFLQLFFHVVNSEKKNQLFGSSFSSTNFCGPAHTAHAHAQTPSTDTRRDRVQEKETP